MDNDSINLMELPCQHALEKAGITNHLLGGIGEKFHEQIWLETRQAVKILSAGGCRLRSADILRIYAKLCGKGFTAVIRSEEERGKSVFLPDDSHRTFCQAVGSSYERQLEKY